MIYERKFKTQYQRWNYETARGKTTDGKRSSPKEHRKLRFMGALRVFKTRKQTECSLGASLGAAGGRTPPLGGTQGHSPALGLSRPAGKMLFGGRAALLGL
jgi:hypothetical protein